MKVLMNRRIEIGSEFWDVPITQKENNTFSQYTQWFISGRSALKAIIKELYDCHTVAMPSWCCDSMIKPFLDAGMTINFYPVYFRGELVQEIRLDSEVLYVMDYFGYTLHNPDLSSYKGIIIRDVTHSVFSSSYSDADYYFGSLRKWCGVWTGGYAWARNGHPLVMEDTDDYGYVRLREMAMKLKYRYIKSLTDANGDEITDKEYLKIYDAAEACLEHIGIAPAAEKDMRMTKKLDVELIRNQRRTNAKVLMESFSKELVFQNLEETDCPMFVPILVPNGKRNALRTYLIKNDIYCPVHWPISEYHRIDERVESIYENELSLVCDQRYTEDDMEYMVKTIKLFWEEA